ncbi:MAG: hypothetical protein C0404_08595 [Verrucomicrobia bacterium]|nr:hypothetical protein [Verrucomicrobiota bacterium]
MAVQAAMVYPKKKEMNMNTLSGSYVEKRPGLLVIVGGLVTSAISLSLVFVLDKLTDSFNIMGFYLNYVIPAGALVIGLIAGSGYGAVSLWRGIKISKGLLWVVMGLQLVAYFVAQYLEYLDVLARLDDGVKLTFLQYYDFMARAFAWKQENGSVGTPLGLWGYAFRALEAAGFAFGGLIVPVILLKKPYCMQCQVYMKSRDLCLIPAGVQEKKIKKKDTEAQAAYEAEIKQALTEGQNALSQLQAHAQGWQADEFKKIVKFLVDRNRTTGKLTGRIAMKLVFCRRCRDGYLAPVMLTGQGEAIAMTPLATVKLDPQFVGQITT